MMGDVLRCIQVKRNTSFVIDYDFARSCYPQGRHRVHRTATRLRPAFLFTNEHLNQTLALFNNAGRDVLTVAASGDQPLFYAAHGARHIDTFDMTFCAKVIMDIKTAALGNFKYDEYVQFLGDMAKSQYLSHDIMDVAKIGVVMANMPSDAAEFVRTMSRCNIFSAGVYSGIDVLAHSPHSDMYVKMQRKIHAPFNFIWSDIADVQKYLTTRYDIINTSNIFEWLDVNTVPTILKNLFPFLNKGGYILATMFGTDQDIENAFDAAAIDLSKNAQVSYIPTLAEHAIMLHRVR